MAKNTNGKWRQVAVVSSAVVIISVASSAITKYANNRHQVDDTVTDVAELKEDGCDPAIESRADIKVINVKLEGLKEDVKESRIEQRADTQEILTAIKEKK